MLSKFYAVSNDTVQSLPSPMTETRRVGRIITSASIAFAIVALTRDITEAVVNLDFSARLGMQLSGAPLFSIAGGVIVGLVYGTTSLYARAVMVPFKPCLNCCARSLSHRLAVTAATANTLVAILPVSLLVLGAQIDPHGSMTFTYSIFDSSCLYMAVASIALTCFTYYRLNAKNTAVKVE